MLLTLARFGLAHALHYAARGCAPEFYRPPPGTWALERLAQAQQLACLLEKRKPGLTPRRRLFWVLYRACFPAFWKQHLRIVKPQTVVGWHAQGVRLLLRWRSRSKKRGRNPLTREVRALIHKMAEEKHWGATRTHGELLKLGIDISERTVSRYLKRLFPLPEDRLKQWRTFLRNEAVAAMDYVVVTRAFAPALYALVVVGHGRREVLHVNVTEHPCAAWVSQQLREAFPGDRLVPKYLVHDGDTTFRSTEVRRTLAGLGIKPARTAFRCPWQNGICERFIGTVRRELLAHVIIFSDRHLLRLLREYAAYYNTYRTHLALNKDSPYARPACSRAGAAALRSIAHVGGLQHHYEWASAPDETPHERLAA